MKTIKELFTILAFVSSFTFSLNADSERKIMMDFRNPIENAEANTKAWYSFNTGFGKIGDLLSSKTDEHLHGRIAQFVTLSYINGVSGFYSHEFGHGRIGLTQPGYSFKIDINDWSKLMPNYIPIYRNRLSREASKEMNVSGLNQSELNAQYLHSQTREEQTFDEGIGFLLRKLSGLMYDGYSSRHLDIDQDGDVYWYVRELNKEGIEMKREQFYKQAALSVALSMKTWDSLLANYDYLVYEERTRKTSMIKLNDWNITPPLVSLYMTPKGSFFNTTTYLEMERSLWELQIGWDDDLIGESELNRIRIGGRLVDKKLWNSDLAFRTSPFMYGNINKTNGGLEGVSVGVELFKPLTDCLGISVKYEFNIDDVIENGIKGEDEGHNVTVGLELKL